MKTVLVISGIILLITSLVSFVFSIIALENYDDVVAVMTMFLSIVFFAIGILQLLNSSDIKDENT